MKFSDISAELHSHFPQRKYFWGSPSVTGSLCNVRELISRKLVTKAVKVFNVGDEFLVHTFRAHLKSRICSVLGIASASDDIPETHRACSG